MALPRRAEQKEVSYSSVSDEVESLCDELNRAIAEDKSSGMNLYSDLYHLPSIPRNEEREYVSRAIDQFNIWIEDPEKASEALNTLQGTVYEKCKTLTKEHAESWKIAMKVKLYRNWKRAIKAKIKSSKKK